MLKKLIKSLLRSEHAPSRAASIARDSAHQAGREQDEGPQDLLRRAESLTQAGRLAAALDCYRLCVRNNPDRLDAHLGMANILVDLWSMEEAVAAYGKALELAPRSAAVFSALLFHHHYLRQVDRRRLFDLHRQFGEVMKRVVPLRNAGFKGAPDPRRRIRVGYVSPNFSRHSVGYFAEPVIANHDRENYEVFCYYGHPLADETTERMRGLADGWRNIVNASDDAVEDMVRDDGIDILIDLAGHSKGNRLGVFARKPAPLQMTWLGYPNTTGLDAVDFRITDSVADLAPAAEQWHTERLLRLDEVFLCYRPPADSPPVSARSNPATAVVFSSFNNIAKVNEPLLRLWGKILGAVAGSRLVIKSGPLDHPDTVDRVIDCIERAGIDPERIELRGWMKERGQHLGLYDQVDIALDTFPYNGTTTTCEALWMGVPVVSQAGDAHMSRVGATILRCAGLNDLVAQRPEEYVETAVALAQDQARRKSLRTDLRTKLLSSPLLDHRGYTRRLEHHLRRCWAAWCDGQRPA